MFDAITGRYDFLNHLLSFFQDYRWRRAMVREVLPLRSGRILDLAAGTGDSSAELLDHGFSVTGADISRSMLSVACKKLSELPFAAVQASVYALPFADGTFDGLTCAFGIRNMHETAVALREIRRVLKPGGTAVLLEFTMPRGMIRTPYRFYIRHLLPNVARLFSQKPAYDYLADTIERFYTPEQLSHLALQEGFDLCIYRGLSMGCVYVHTLRTIS